MLSFTKEIYLYESFKTEMVFREGCKGFQVPIPQILEN